MNIQKRIREAIIPELGSVIPKVGGEGWTRVYEAKKGKMNFQTKQSLHMHNHETAVWYIKTWGRAAARRAAVGNRQSVKREQLDGSYIRKGPVWCRQECSVTHDVCRAYTKRFKANKWKGNIYALERLFYRPVVLSLGEILHLPPFPGEKISQSPEIFLVAKTGRCYWHLVGRGQRCCYTSYSEQACPTAITLTNSAVGENPITVKVEKEQGGCITQLESSMHTELMRMAPSGAERWTAGLAIHGGLNHGEGREHHDQRAEMRSTEARRQPGNSYDFSVG